MRTHSIIILTKDRPALLPRAVASARGALRAGGEIVIIDDASVIPARDILAEFDAPDLHIVRLDGPLGISAARNAGIAASTGSVIFFLDDDDELMPHYLQSILDGPAGQFDYGFSNYVTVSADGTLHHSKPRFATGAISSHAPLRKQFCGTGMGFWINRPVALDIGPFSTEIAINEDTDFLCRLIAQRRNAHYSARAGVTLYHHSAEQNVSNITARTTAVQRAKVMEFICDRYPMFAAHFGRSFLRHCAKAGLHIQAQRYILRQPEQHLRLSFAGYYAAKRLLYMLKFTLLRSA